MSCCSGSGYCQFQFPPGPPLTDNPVGNLNAQYLFLPYGTLLAVGETIRIWMENGQTKVVRISAKYPIEILPAGPVLFGDKQELPWHLIALDSDMDYDTLMDWYHHPLHNAKTQSVVLEFKHPVTVQPTIKMRLLQLLYKIRTL